MRLLLAFLALAFLAHAGTIDITLSGTLEQWQGKSVYDAQLSQPLAVPTPFSMGLQIDEGAIDQDPAADHGLYISPSGIFRFNIGADIHYSFSGCMVEVYSGRSGLWGFVFRNYAACAFYGVAHPAATGFYAFYLNSFSQGSALTDALHWVVDSQFDFYPRQNSHAYLNGLTYLRVTVHAEADNNISGYSAVIIP